MNNSEFSEYKKIGIALRWKNGEYVVDKELTEKLAKQEQEIDNSVKELYNSFRTEGTYYKVEELEGDYVTLINQDTGVRFGETTFSKEFYDSLSPGMMLKYEHGKYVIDNNYLNNETKKIIDEDELIAQTVQKIKGQSNEINQVGKVLDFVSDLLIDLIETKGYGDINTYFVIGQKDGKVNVAQRFGTLVSSWVVVEGDKNDIEFGTILRKKDGKFVIDEELTEESLQRIRNIEGL